MEVLTTEPGLQFFSGNFPDGKFGGKGGKTYPSRSGLCLEAQHYPDSPHHAEFPVHGAAAGETYAQTTSYRFSVESEGKRQRLFNNRYHAERGSGRKTKIPKPT